MSEVSEERAWYIRYKHKLVPCLEKMRGHVLDNLEKYLTVQDFVGPAKFFATRIIRQRPDKQMMWGIEVAAFLWLRGMPPEYVCYPVDWERKECYGLFMSLGMYGMAAVRTHLGSLLPEKPKPKDIYAWVSGEEEPPEEVKTWLDKVVFRTETKPRP